MPEIVHGQIAQFMQDLEVKPSAWLIHGEEMLVEKCCRQVSDVLLGDADRALHLEAVDGLAENIPDLLEKLNTFSLLGGPKLVLFKDTGIFDAKGKQARLITRIEQAWQGEQPQKAAKAFFSLCVHLGIDPTEMLKASAVRTPGLSALIETLGAKAVDALLQHCRELGWSSARQADQVEVLRGAVEKGFPSGHLLIITVNSKVAKNLKFYKTVAGCGVVIDCSVPQSERRADKQAREQILRQAMEELLGPAGKRVAPGMFDRLCQLTGFDLRIFTRNIEKLVDYTGQRTQITGEDIQAVVQRTKLDPIYELTNAVSERNRIQALFFLDSLLSADFHPLQILAALANQIRKLLVAKDFSESELGRAWSAGMPYPQFQQSVLPAVQTFDEQVTAQVRAWNPDGTAIKSKEPTDLRLAPNPKNAYPVFQTLLKSTKYSRAELEQAIALLSQADQSIKSSNQTPVLILKKVVGDICG